MADGEQAVLDAVHAYLRARYDAFQRAQQGDRQAYEERKARVDDLSRAMLAAIMELGPRHPNDRGTPPTREAFQGRMIPAIPGQRGATRRRGQEDDMGKFVRMPWINISLGAMIRDVVEQGTITLTVERRDDVQTRRWYSLAWTGADGMPYVVAASDLQLALRRAAEAEQKARMDDPDWEE